jgi:D-alanyl-D-alanine carboxypeptidase
MPNRVTRTHRFLAILIVALCFSGARAIAAAEVSVVDLTVEDAGGSVRLDDGFNLGIRDDTISTPARVTVVPGAALASPLPARYAQAGTAYKLDIETANETDLAMKSLWLRVPATPQPNTATVLLGYDEVTLTWSVIGGKIDAANVLTGSTYRLHTTIVPAADLATKPGTFSDGITITAMSVLADIPAGSASKTFGFQNYAITLRAQAFTQAGTFVVTPDAVLPSPLPARYKQRAGVLQVGFRGLDGQLLRLTKGVTITPKVLGNGFYPQRVLFYNPNAKVWEVTKSNTAYVMGYAVVVDDIGEEVGIASWYKSKKNPDGVAHNRYPMGTKLKVTNLENGKSTVVRVVSRGPYVRGRVVDLVYTAFKKIKGSNGGLARVRVSAVDPKVLGDSTILPAVPATPATQLVSNPVALPVSSTAGIAYDVEKGVVAAGKNIDEQHPIASLTKLMTALVYLDRKPTFKNIVTYQKVDSAICACLYVSPGETMTANDLWHAMLIGSANNATRALARSTGLSEAAFVKLMNEKAKTLGLSSLTFADPTGLDPANQGSARDMAKLAAIAFQRSEISSVVIEKSYTFTTRNTKKVHTVTNRNKMLETGWQVTGIKTGYIEESGNCLITQVKGQKTGRTIVTVILGAASAAKQYADTETSLSIGFANLQ